VFESTSSHHLKNAFGTGLAPLKEKQRTKKKKRKGNKKGEPPQPAFRGGIATYFWRGGLV
jgi:hypothetical protein